LIAVLLLAAAIVPIPRVHTADVSVEGYETVPPPRMEMRRNVASATTTPWVDANGWRYMRGLKKALYAKLPPDTAPIAAAEAFAYGVDAILEPAAEDETKLSAMLSFLKSIEAPPLPVRANIGILDDGTPELGEVLNLLTRRNLSYKVVTAPDPKLDLNIKVGSEQYPRSAIANPADFAARVREKLKDEKRVIRVFNSSTVISYVTGDNKHTRVHLLNYGRRPSKDIRIRVLGEFSKVSLKEASNPNQQAADVVIADKGTEWTVGDLPTYAVIDLER
jgi:hypothetical protein